MACPIRQLLRLNCYHGKMPGMTWRHFSFAVTTIFIFRCDHRPGVSIFLGGRKANGKIVCFAFENGTGGVLMSTNVEKILRCLR